MRKLSLIALLVSSAVTRPPSRKHAPAVAPPAAPPRLRHPPRPLRLPAAARRSTMVVAPGCRWTHRPAVGRPLGVTGRGRGAPEENTRAASGSSTLLDTFAPRCACRGVRRTRATRTVRRRTSGTQITVGRLPLVPDAKLYRLALHQQPVGPWTELNFHYGNARVKATVQIGVL